jgi:hypothetical protein
MFVKTRSARKLKLATHVVEIEMSTADIAYVETEQQRIESWRMETLERAGYDRRAAAILASRKDIDLHQAIALLQRGCSPELALEILL